MMHIPLILPVRRTASALHWLLPHGVQRALVSSTDCAGTSGLAELCQMSGQQAGSEAVMT